MTIILLIAGLAIGAVGQALKSLKGIPNEIVVLVLSLLGFGFYMLQAGPPATWWPLPEQWSLNAAAWVAALPGVASGIGHVVPGMKTNSR